MKTIEIKNETMLENLKEEGRYILYFKTASCSVCDVMLDKIMEEFTDVDLTMGLIQIETMPKMRGQYLVFSGPTLIAFDGDQEVHRESRFIELDRMRNVFDMWLN